MRRGGPFHVKQYKEFPFLGERDEMLGDVHVFAVLPRSKCAKATSYLLTAPLTF